MRRRNRRIQRIQDMLSDQASTLSLYNTFGRQGRSGAADSPFTPTARPNVNYNPNPSYTRSSPLVTARSTSVPLKTTTATTSTTTTSQRTTTTSTSGNQNLVNYQAQEGELRLVGGRTENEGNIQVFHESEWGSICDDEWDITEAKIACKQMGFPGAIGPTHSSQFGYSLPKIWLDNMFCYGTEKNITDCRFDGWGVHDCETTEAAGVRCHERPPPTTPPPPTTTPKPLTPISHAFDQEFEVRISGGRVPEEGRVEIRLHGTNRWGTVCGDGWGIPEAMVVCKQVGLRYALSAPQTHLFTPTELNFINGSTEQLNKFREQPLITGVSCRGNEESLFECGHDADNFCPGSGTLEVAGVVCVENQADLEPDIYELMASTHLEDKPLFFLSCAMEENCLASEAYRIRKDRHDYATVMRRLLRFTTSIANVGNADFRPFIQKEQWIWHSCHQHYHSMEVFAHFDILDHNGVRVAEGHKASFCLEDNHCVGVEPKYDCENYGDQGITPGCKDIYYYNIDCQWLDVTELPLGTYTFKMAINPEFKVAEQTFENNAAVCVLVYAQQFATIRNCTLQRP